jgi:hypothetical protein
VLISFRGKKNIPARVLLDSGCTTPIASEKWIEEHNVQFVTRKELKNIRNFAGDTVENYGWCYTFPITGQHGDHYSKETFEIGCMEDSYDVMLPYWWIVKYKARGFTDGGKISFESEECMKTCTKHNCNSFTIEMEDTIPSPVFGPRKGPLSRVLRLVAYNNTATHLNPPLECYELKDN